MIPNFIDTIKEAVAMGASDIFVVPGAPTAYKIGNIVEEMQGKKLTPVETGEFIEEIYAAAERDMDRLQEQGDDDFAISLKGISRLRVNTYKQRGSFAAVIRIVSFGIPDWRSMNIPEAVMETADNMKGLVLVSGPAGSGKSTTLACLIDRVNKTRSGHVITIEDPIEYLYNNDKCIISQREIGLDTADFVTALRASLRQAPDIILLGEMRDYETIKTALTAVETGHLVFSTLHTAGAANTVERIIDIFPPNQQQQVRLQLAMLLNSVISQRLVPGIDGRMIPAFEIMHVNSAISNLIREAKTHQIDNVIGLSAASGMVSMDSSLQELYGKGLITRETAIAYSLHPDIQEKRI